MSDNLEKTASDDTEESGNGNPRKTAGPRSGGLRSIFTLRKLLLAAGFGVAALFLISIIGFFAVRIGLLDGYVKDQFSVAFLEMGVRMEAERFELTLNPLRLNLEKAVFTNKKTGAKLAQIENAKFEMSVLDLFAPSSIRNISIDRTEINGANVWIEFDENGKSNYEGIELLPPKNNVRFQYASAEVALRDSVIHFGDMRWTISGKARNVSLFLKPDAVRPADSKDLAFLFDLSSDVSNFKYDKGELKPVDLKASGRLHPNGADIKTLVLKTPVGSSVLSGTIKDWSRLIYDLDISSTIDLTQASTIFPMGTAISGVGSFTGKVSGEGENYKIVGEATSDSLAASNIRLKAAKVTADVNGEGTIYKASGKAVAELLTFGDFRIDFPSLVGNIRGSGTNFKWLGELQAAAASSPLGTIGSLYITDAVAEYEDNRLAARLGNFRARKFTNDSVNLESIQTANIRITSADGNTNAVIPYLTAGKLDVLDSTMRGISVNSINVDNRNGATDVTAGNVQVDEYASGDTRVKNSRATDVKVGNRNGLTTVTAARVETGGVSTKSSKTENVVASNISVDSDGRETRVNSGNVRIARVQTDSAILANLNIAGVRLTVRDGIIAGTTADFDAGDIDLRGNGKLENVAVRKPVFVLEPSGRYRASLDMSLGSGVIGSIRLGAARASVVAGSETVELNSLTAEVMDGKLDGNAKIAFSANRNSELKADFTDLDLSKLLALQGGRVIPIEGKTRGTAELTFRGTDFRSAGGFLNAEIEANAGTADSGLIPVSGRLAANGANGLFQIDVARLNTPQTTLVADGRFDMAGNDSDLSLALNSSDASEIERIVRVLDIAPELERQIDDYRISLAGVLVFNGGIKGNLENPLIEGRASLASLLVRDRDLGTLVTSFNSSASGIEVRNGILQARDGGSVDFSAEIPGYGLNNTAVRAKLNDINLANLMSLVPIESIPTQLRDIEGKTTGAIDLSGLPGEMKGEANLSARNGTINGQSFENLESNAIFEGTLVRLTRFDAGFGNGSLSATGFYKSDSTEFNFDVNAASIPAEKILAFAPKTESLPELDGVFNFTANVSGRSDDTSTYDLNFRGSGNGFAINRSRFGNIEFEGTTENRVLNASAAAMIEGRKQLFSARVDFGDERLPFHAETNLDRSAIGPYLAIFRPSEPDSVSISGTATGRIVIDGELTAADSEGKRYFTSEKLSGVANLSQFALQFDDTPLTATEPVIVRFSPREVTFENAKFSGAGSNLVVSGTKALTDTGINNLAIDGRVNLGIVRAFSRKTLRNVFVSGIANVSVRLSGVNSTARLNGTAVLENGSAATFVGSNRVTFERVNGRVRFTTNQVQIEQFTAFLGGGRITASGGALLNDRLALDRIRLELRGSNITVPLPDDFVTTGNANIEISGRLDGDTFASFVSGTVVARRSIYRKDIDLADLIGSRRDAGLAQTTDSDPTGDISYSPTRLDIRIIGREALVVRNNLADLTASVDLRLAGDSDSPRLSGRISANRGTLFFRDDRYEVQRGVLTFPPDSAIEPRINLQAETDIGAYQILINLSGNLSDADSLTAVVASNPSLPQADIMSLITTGSLSNTNDGIPTIAQGGLNTAAEILTDEIINKPITRATDKLFGINRFELNPIVSGQRGNPTARLTVGRQINRNLLVTYSTNLSQDQNQVLAVEYRLSNRLSVVGAYEQRSLSNVTQNRNKFSVEIRFRKRF